MPHQCVRCSKLYDDGDKAILTGCSCGAKLFFYIKKEKLEKVREQQEKAPALSEDERKQIEEDVYDLLGSADQDLPVVLDLESVKILKPGKFELDLVQLFNKRQPLVYRVEEGRYVIDLANSFRERRKDL
ncbi:MAG: OapC/ArvC family zinc-ribbon domain-containing protein [Nanoarchaeota archaeon]